MVRWLIFVASNVLLLTLSLTAIHASRHFPVMESAFGVRTGDVLIWLGVLAAFGAGTIRLTEKH